MANWKSDLDKYNNEAKDILNLRRFSESLNKKLNIYNLPGQMLDLERLFKTYSKIKIYSSFIKFNFLSFNSVVRILFQ